MTKKYPCSRDTSYSDSGGLAALKKEFAIGPSAKAEDHGAKYRAMTQDGSSKHPAGNTSGGNSSLAKKLGTT